MTLSQAAQDYLRAIYKQTIANGRSAATIATTTQLAAALNVRPASVTTMVQKLAQASPALVVYHRHQGVELTPAGEAAALRTIRHHRLLETFLVDKLGYDWTEVHDEAERLEHAVTPMLAARLDAVLHNPTHNPHGKPIPTADLTVVAATAVPLATLPCGQTAVLSHVHDEDPDLLRQSERLGLVPGATLTVHQTPTGTAVTVSGMAETAELSPALLAILFVKPMPSGN